MTHLLLLFADNIHHSLPRNSPLFYASLPQPIARSSSFDEDIDALDAV